MDAIEHFDSLYGDMNLSPKDGAQWIFVSGWNCAMLHKPRFYAPVYWLKDTWGWKRKCEDFQAKLKEKNT